MEVKFRDLWGVVVVEQAGPGGPTLMSSNHLGAPTILPSGGAKARQVDSRQLCSCMQMCFRSVQPKICCKEYGVYLLCDHFCIGSVRLLLCLHSMIITLVHESIFRTVDNGVTVCRAGLQRLRTTVCSA